MLMDPRYSRQLVIPDFADGGQQRLARARVLVLGAGGLGCTALPALAGAGVGDEASGGWLHIADPDLVDVSNLNRQFLYREADLGRPKASIAAERLRQLNSHLAIKPLRRAFTSETARGLLASAHLVLDCTDNLASRRLLNHWCYYLGLPFVSAGVSRHSGMLSCFDGITAPCLACVGRYAAAGADCAVDGIVGALAQTFGALMANQAMQYLLGSGFGFSGLWLLDGKHMQATSFAARAEPQCPVCGNAKVKPREQSLEVDWRDCEEGWRLVDIRESSDSGFMHIPAARLRADLYRELGDPRPACLVLVCERGVASRELAQELSCTSPPMRILSLRGGMAAIREQQQAPTNG